MAKRNIFGELMEGVAAMKNHREGKVTLRTYKIDVAPLPKVDSKFLRDTRKKLRCSRAVFARRLRINERTWRNGSRAVRNESSGSGARSSRPQIPGHAGATGRIGGRIGWGIPALLFSV